jgi:hypothetical protein
MIVHDFDILGVPHRPPKTDSPLVVDSHTHLACSLSFQQFRAISRRVTPGCIGASFFVISVASMIVGKFNGFRTIRGPDKANTKLIVHPDRILPCPVAFQSFQSISRRRSQIVQRFCRM